MATLYSVEDIGISYETISPPNMVISAIGTASSLGWGDFSLSELVHIVPPIDGVQVFSMEGTPPASNPAQTLDPKKPAETVMYDIDIANYWGPGIPLRGIRIIAIMNAVEKAV